LAETEKVGGAEVPPPGAGVKTLTERVPAMPAPRNPTVSFVALTKVAERAFPFQFTTELSRKSELFTVMGTAEPLAVAPAGEIEVREGAGLLLFAKAFRATLIVEFCAAASYQ
jgi:hypothetical protein